MQLEPDAFYVLLPASSSMPALLQSPGMLAFKMGIPHCFRIAFPQAWVVFDDVPGEALAQMQLQFDGFRSSPVIIDLATEGVPAGKSSTSTSTSTSSSQVYLVPATTQNLSFFAVDEASKRHMFVVVEGQEESNSTPVQKEFYFTDTWHRISFCTSAAQKKQDPSAVITYSWRHGGPPTPVDVVPDQGEM